MLWVGPPFFYAVGEDGTAGKVPFRNGPIYRCMGAWVELYRMVKKVI